MSKVAIVTGAGQGIGFAISKRLVEDGVKVGVLDYDAETAEKAVAELSEDKAFSVVADVSKQAEVAAAFQKVVDHFGDLNVVVNNAGVALTRKAEEITEDEWDQVLDLDLKSVFLCSQRAGLRMIRQQGGKIINTASIMGQVGQKLTLSYCAAKAGVLGLTRALALEWAQYNIQVNALCPGFVLTAINETMMQDEKILKATLRKTPAGRLGQVADLAGAALYLASDASNFMTGQTLTVDGGWTAQ